MADPVAPSQTPATATPSADAPKPTEAPVVAAPQTPPVDPLKPRFDELEARNRKIAAERRKLDEERKAHADKQKQFEEWERVQADRRRNPLKYLAREFGDDWYDKLTQIKLSGSPTADLVLSEVEENTSKLRDEFKSEAQKLREELAARDAAEAARAKADYEAQAVAHVKAQAEKYPLLNLFEEWNAVPAAIEKHFIETCRQDAEGNLLPGEMWTPDQAAAALEQQLSDLEKKLDERRQKLQKPAAPQQQPSDRLTASPPRRTLSTEMTASTGGEWTPPKDDRERYARAMAAMDNALANRGGAA